MVSWIYPMMPMDQLICWMEVGLEVWSVDCHLDYLLLLTAAGAWNLEVYCCHLDYRLDTLLLGAVLLLSHENLMLLLLGVDCLLDWTGLLRLTLCLLLRHLVARLLLTPWVECVRASTLSDM